MLTFFVVDSYHHGQGSSEWYDSHWWDLPMDLCPAEFPSNNPRYHLWKARLFKKKRFYKKKKKIAKNLQKKLKSFLK